MNAQKNRPLKLGLVLPEAEWDMGGKTAGWSDYVAMARLIEDMGIDSIWFVDHLLYRGDATTIEQQGVRECWSILTGLAAITERVELGSLVTPTSYRNPAMLAKIVDTVEVIAEIYEEVKSAATENEPIFVYDNLPVVTCQRTLVKQMFHNLISNGLKYNRSDEPTIWISYEDHYDYHQLSVKDNGIGINVDNFERIFEPFRRLHSRGEVPGSGVGLVICKKIIESFNGKIWLESKPEIGSTFFITFPKKLIQGEDRGGIQNTVNASDGGGA